MSKKRNVTKPGDLLGRRFGKLVVKEEIPQGPGRHTLVVCQCDCGQEYSCRAVNLKTKGFTECKDCMSLPSLEGQKFGRWTVVKFSHRKRHQHYWHCKCDCGTEKVVNGWSMQNNKAGYSRSCGCLKAEKTSAAKLEDLSGRVFGGLEVLERCKNQGRHTKWLCKCTCGTLSEVLADNLKSGNSTSCGVCFRLNIYKHKLKRSGGFNRNINSQLYRGWRKRIYQRDGYKCVVCGKRGRLNAHHLDGWNWAIHSRYNVKNGVTLCANKKGCHKKFHNIYGSGNNTKSQFEKFLLRYGKKNLVDLNL